VNLLTHGIFNRIPAQTETVHNTSKQRHVTTEIPIFVCQKYSLAPNSIYSRRILHFKANVELAF
jgi:hypothetical protein